MSVQTKDAKEIVYKSPHSVDQILSEGLMQLSMKDRNVVEEEIHGVSTLAPSTTESPDLVETSLQELSTELSKIPEDKKVAYMESQLFQNTYVNTPEFRLRFLRCELFDVKRAAKKIVKFLDYASHLFGPAVLQRPMGMVDFTTEEKKWMQNFQILPYRDQSGRAIRTWVGDFAMNQAPPVSIWKVVLYIEYCLSDCVEVQQKGIVNVIWVGANKWTSTFDWEMFGHLKRFYQAAPARTCCYHWCMPPLPPTHPIHMVRAAMAMGLPEEQQRIKFHIGNEIELMYKLKSYGIPVEYIPVTGTGKIKTAYMKQWMRNRKLLESARTSSIADPFVLCPSSNDVLFRKGIHVKCHPGNVMFESMIEEIMPSYSSASLKEKASITKGMISVVHQRGGRFLMWEKDGYWTEVKDDSQLYSKAAQKVRLLAAKLVGSKQTFESSTSAFIFSDQKPGIKRRKLCSNTHVVSDSGSDSDGSYNCWAS